MYIESSVRTSLGLRIISSISCVKIFLSFFYERTNCTFFIVQNPFQIFLSTFDFFRKKTLKILTDEIDENILSPSEVHTDYVDEIILSPSDVH